MANDVEITLREAVPTDAAELLAVTKKIGQETEFLVMDDQGMGLSEELLSYQLADLYDSPTNVLFLALANDQIIGTASIRAESNPRVAHIGELGISILKDYWGMGLGTVMVEELLAWAEESGELARIELTVQVQNTRAVHVYEKVGFKKEAIMPRGARGNDGTFLDVHLMSYLIG